MAAKKPAKKATPSAKMAADMRMDKRMGIAEKSKRDQMMDRKRGVKD